MKIYFCDLCNESVPNGDLENGRALMRNGRVICQACEGAMTTHDEPEGDGAKADFRSGSEDQPATDTTAAKDSQRPRPERSASPVAAMAVALASFSLLGTFGGAAFLFTNTDERIRSIEDELGAVRRDALSDGRAIESRLNDDLRRTGEEISDARTGLAELRARLEESSRSQGDSVARLSDDFIEWEARLREFEAITTKIERHERELSLIRDSTDTLRTDLRIVDNRIQEQRERVEDQARATEEAVEAEDAKPAWWGLVAELQNQNSGVRWQAVQSLGATKDATVAEHLTPMLKDPDIFVRMATARILGDLQAMVGIPALIAALEDPEASVREASVVSLRSVTGQNFRFDPSGKDSERSKRVKAWRDWWEKSADDLLGS